jgi:hypothetical protein
MKPLDYLQIRCLGHSPLREYSFGEQKPVQRCSLFLCFFQAHPHRHKRGLKDVTLLELSNR